MTQNNIALFQYEVNPKDPFIVWINDKKFRSIAFGESYDYYGNYSFIVLASEETSDVYLEILTLDLTTTLDLMKYTKEEYLKLFKFLDLFAICLPCGDDFLKLSSSYNKFSFNLLIDAKHKLLSIKTARKIRKFINRFNSRNKELKTYWGEPCQKQIGEPR